MKTPNARFNHYHCFGNYDDSNIVKITLKPGERLSFSSGGNHEEGYSSEHYSWHYDSDDFVYMTVSGCGRDCDGYTSYSTTFRSHVMQLRKVNRKIFPSGKYYLSPDWKQVESERYDQEAERAGY